MYFSFTDILKIITIFQIFLLSAFILFSSSRSKMRNLLLVAFILSKAFYLLDTLLIQFYKVVLPLAPNLILIGSSFQWLIGPTLFYTIVVTTHKEFVFKYKHLLNFLPFILNLGFIITQYHIYDYHTKYNLLLNWFPYTAPWGRMMACANYIHFAIYGVLALLVLTNVREEMIRISSQSVDRNISYFKFLIYDFITAWGINTIVMFLPLSSMFYYVLGILTVSNICFIANAMVFQGLKFPEIFLDITSNKQKYEKHPLTEAEKNRYVEKLNIFMSTQKPYLNPTLSLSDIADELAIPTYTLSQVLNLVLKQNFYDFVNKYRIEESKRLLLIEPGNGSTILEILYKCGFNSKSVFNAAFKKYTDMTPREYKKHLQLNQQKEALPVSLS
jgi:AraC-like DNA-binding protein